MIRYRVQEMNFIHRSVGTGQEELLWLCSHQFQNDFASDLYKPTLSVAVRHMWRCRNDSIHQQKAVFAPGVVKSIVADVQFVTSRWKGISRTRSHCALVLKWGLDIHILN
ncbi:hypothetical protein ACH5RR_006990 [Cinchona calisaya]|uniref:Uncharacterized protein n=1 Tax=Cinchona calisaya TaxID=153742 RepID=A0ABD3AQM8_9GENT